MTSPFSPFIPRRAFSLIELLVVIAIMSLVAAFSVPAFTNTIRAYSLSSAGNAVASQLIMARQTAMAEGHAVQARFYFLPNYNQSSPTPAVYRGMQCFLEGDPVVTSGTISAPTSALSNPLYFSSPVVILADITRSTLLPVSASSLLAADPKHPLGSYALNYKYVVFRFTPDGRTDLPNTLACVTLVIQQDAVNPGTKLPPNFVTVQIDPVTGAVRNLHP